MFFIRGPACGIGGRGERERGGAGVWVGGGSGEVSWLGGLDVVGWVGAGRAREPLLPHPSSPPHPLFPFPPFLLCRRRDRE